MAHFFALLDVPPDAIRRVVVNRDLEAPLADLFREQRDRLLAAGRESVEFDAGFRPDEGQVSYIGGYELPGHISAAIRNPIGCDVLTMELEDLPPIKGIIASDEETGEVLCQAFDRRRLLSRRGFSLILAGQTFRRLEEPGVTLDSKLAAAFSDGRLYFESYFVARRILDLSAYYLEATDADLRDFCRRPTLAIANPAWLVEIADSITRRKIAAIRESRVLELQTPRRIQQVGGHSTWILLSNEAAATSDWWFPKTRSS